MNMFYKFIDKKSERTLILLHGTGGDEHDLLFLGEQIDPKANLLGLRGRINENGLNRFFKRLSPGIFDVNNLIEETKYLDKFLKAFIKVNKLNKDKISLIGFSNGANIIGSHLYHYGKVYDTYILMHPMVPIKDFDIADQNNNKILITAGENDALVSIDETKELSKSLIEKKADVTLNLYSFGHRLSENEIKDSKKWYKKNRL